MAKQFSIVGTLLAVLQICIYYYADPDPGSKESPYGSGSQGVKTKEKLHQKIFNSIFHNEIKKSLKINKQDITLSITKGSLLQIFQF